GRPDWQRVVEEGPMKIVVILNGTKVNPFLRYGLKRNPFPQIARSEYAAADRALATLAAEPIPNADYIRKVLAGVEASAEFVDLCCQKFKPGERVKFSVQWPL